MFLHVISCYTYENGDLTKKKSDLMGCIADLW